MKKRINSLLSKGMWVSVVLFVGRCLLSLDEIKEGISIYSLFGFASEAISIATIITVCYEKWLWRFDPFCKIPHIAGRYNGKMLSSYDGIEREVEVVIQQSMLSVEVRLKTDESFSRSISGSIEEIFGSNELIYTYLNEPNANIRDRSAIHFGTATFVINEKKKLCGKYYSDRKTSGEIRLEMRDT